MRTILILVFLTFSVAPIFGQSLEELNTMKAEKEAILAERSAAAAEIQAEVDAINAKIKALPGWEKGLVGIVGFDFNGNNSWFANANPDSKSNGLGLGLSGHANYDQAKYFWNNMATINLKRVVTDLNNGSESTEAVSDVLDISSLFGYKLSDKLSVSAEARYSSTVFNFNDPGKLVAGLGISWLPFAGHVVTILPLAYEKNWPGEFISAPGAKIGATLVRKIGEKISWSSNLNAFIPYSGGTTTLTGPTLMEDVEFSAGEIVNWTWLNGFSTTIWKGIGLGLNVGLRQDRQIAESAFYSTTDVRIDKNPLQMFYTFGISYAL